MRVTKGILCNVLFLADWLYSYFTAAMASCNYIQQIMSNSVFYLDQGFLTGGKFPPWGNIGNSGGK